MEVEIFSDPLWGVGGQPGVTSADIPKLPRYDEQLVKPALLLGDHVTLRTWRLDLRYGEVLEGNIVKFGVPLSANVGGVVTRHSPHEMQLLGIDEGLYFRLKSAWNRHLEAGAPTFDPDLLDDGAVRECAVLKHGFHRRQFMGLDSPALRAVSDRGLLAVEPWDDREASSWIQADWDHHHTSFDHGWSRMEAALESSSGALLLDEGVGERLVATELSTDYPSVQTLNNAVELLRMIDGLSDATLDEVVDIRADLAPYLIPFRGFVLQRSAAIDLDPGAPIAEKRRQVALAWESEVAPAVRELEHHVNSSKFLSTLAKTAGDGPEAAIGIGLGLATALGSGAIGVTALAGVGVAALPTLIKAAGRTLDARRQVRRDGAYLIYDVKRRLRRRRRS
ncbi:hypothetical protein [Cellulomonas cellasea]|nr:hypothetical protein [Cellulomonas cellasea]GEA86969.1 hypothetical protein CCE01nite_09180 [Cellulomonas cellasea]